MLKFEASKAVVELLKRAWLIVLSLTFELPLISSRTVDGCEKTETHEVLKTWTIVAVFLSIMGAVVQKPVARSTITVKKRCGGS